MDHVGAIAGRESHREQTEWIVRPRRHPRRQRIASGRMFLTHRFGWIPDRVLFLGDHMGYAARRLPLHLTDTDRVGDHLARLAALRFWIVVEPVLRQIDDDALMRGRRQDMTTRNDDL